MNILILFEIDFSSPWADGFQSNRDSIKDNLYIVHPTHRQVLELCNKTLSPRIMVDFKRIRYIQSSPFLFLYGFCRSMGPLDFPHLRAYIVRDIERNEDYLSSSWYPLICQIFQTGQVQGINPTPEKMNSFYNSINTLISNQVDFYLLNHLKIFRFSYVIFSNEVSIHGVQYSIQMIKIISP